MNCGDKEIYFYHKKTKKNIIAPTASRAIPYSVREINREEQWKDMAFEVALAAKSAHSNKAMRYVHYCSESRRIKVTPLWPLLPLVSKCENCLKCVCFYAVFVRSYFCLFRVCLYCMLRCLFSMFHLSHCSSLSHLSWDESTYFFWPEFRLAFYTYLNCLSSSSSTMNN